MFVMVSAGVGLADGFAAGFAAGFFGDFGRGLAIVFAAGFLTPDRGFTCSIRRRIVVSAMTRARITGSCIMRACSAAIAESLPDIDTPLMSCVL